MRPGVCSAPEPAPERDRPSEGCQLLAREKRNYVAQRRQVRAFHESVAQRRNPFPRLRVTPSCYAFVVRLRLTSLVVPVDKCPPASEVPADSRAGKEAGWK